MFRLKVKKIGKDGKELRAISVCRLSCGGYFYQQNFQFCQWPGNNGGLKLELQPTPTGHRRGQEKRLFRFWVQYQARSESEGIRCGATDGMRDEGNLHLVPRLETTRLPSPRRYATNYPHLPRSPSSGCTLLHAPCPMSEVWRGSWNYFGTPLYGCHGANEPPWFKI